jgi:hypothetical protein
MLSITYSKFKAFAEPVDEFYFKDFPISTLRIREAWDHEVRSAGLDPSSAEYHLVVERTGPLIHTLYIGLGSCEAITRGRRLLDEDLAALVGAKVRRRKYHR